MPGGYFLVEATGAAALCWAVLCCAGLTGKTVEPVQACGRQRPATLSPVRMRMQQLAVGLWQCL